MRIGIPRESRPGETLVAATAKTASQLVSLGYDVVVEQGAGTAADQPDAAYADRTFDDDIETALATLPPDFRAAVVLCDVEGLSYEEIAEIMDAKLGTVIGEQAHEALPQPPILSGHIQLVKPSILWQHTAQPPAQRQPLAMSAR